MTEAADLLAAIAASPADDLPRMVFADWLDDRGETAYAQFVRDQIRLAQVPAWDPLAVRARHQLKDSLGIGKPFFGTLPELPNFLKWHPEKAFRRGFGSGVIVHQLSGLLEAGQQLFDVAPVDELWLSAATLDQWRQFAKSPWLQNVRKLHLHFSQGLHEPIRCLAESKYAGNIDEIWFDTLATPAAGTVIEALAESPMAKQLNGLHMRLVHTPSLPEVIEALFPMNQLKSLSLNNAGLDWSTLGIFTQLEFLDQLNELHFSQNLFDDWMLAEITNRIQFKSLQRIDFSNCRIISSLIKPFQIEQMKIMNYSGNTIDHDQILKNLWVPKFTGMKSLDFSKCGININFIIKLSEFRIWNSLNELNISDNQIASRGYLRLIELDFPNEMTSLILDRKRSDEITVKKLESHFGDRLVWSTEDAATGLSQ